MANFKLVNAAVKKKYPALDVEVVRGKGYVYFFGEDAFDKIDTLYTHPTSTSTEDMIRMVFENIDDSLKENQK